MKIKKINLLLLLILIPILLFSKVKHHNVVEQKGKKYYLQNCSNCHGSGNMGGNLALTREWKEYFSKNAKELKSFHEENQKVTNYLNSKVFKTRHKRRILKFLLEFAADSDNIPSCNN